MKKRNILCWLLMGIIIFANTDCTKVVEPPDNTRIIAPPPPPPPPPPQPPTTVALKAGAGPDHLIFLPTNYCTIGGWVSGYATFTVQWSKISGPSSFFIEDPNGLGTKVNNLVNGVYEFEITVSANGLTAKDTCTVTVGTMSSNPNEIIFENQHWGTEGLTSSLLWGSAIIINNIHQFFPVGTVFKTYIKRDSTTSWEELVPGTDNSWYIFSIMNGSLCVWSSYDETDTPDIKLVY